MGKLVAVRIEGEKIKSAEFRVEHRETRDPAELFEESGMNVYSAVDRACAKNNGKIKALDVGAADARILFNLKHRLGDKIETHALSIYEEPRAPVDAEHVISAEFMPAQFKELFNLEISHRTLQYVTLPHLALRNMAHSLARNGISLFQWSGSKIELGLDIQQIAELREHYKGYLKGIFSGSGIKISINGKIHESELDMSCTKSQAKNKVERIIGEGGLNEMQSLAFSAELAIVNGMQGFSLSIQSYEESSIGSFPYLVLIERD
jgi:hypothetical protein